MYDIKTKEGFHGARNYGLPRHPDDNSNTTGGRESRGNSRGRSAKSGASSREPSSERGEKSMIDCVRTKYNLAKMQYKYARESMPNYKRTDFYAVAIMLCKNDPTKSVLDYIRMHGIADEKYYQEFKIMFPNFVDTDWEYKDTNPAAMYKYHIHRATMEMKKGGFDYNTHMSKAKMAALAVNKMRASPEDEMLLFQDYIVKHSTPDEASKAIIQQYFPGFSHDIKGPGQSAPSAGHAPLPPANPRGGGGRVPALDKPLTGANNFSSFETQHFGEAVPDDYRV